MTFLSGLCDREQEPFLAAYYDCFLSGLCDREPGARAIAAIA